MAKKYLLTCRECNQEVNDYLGDHLLEAHSLTIDEYLVKHPGAETISARLWDRHLANSKNVRRQSPPDSSNLTIKFANIPFRVNHDVPLLDCLPEPDHYRVPQFGNLGEDVQHAAIALKHNRPTYIWGLPGSGKDALYHAWSARTRTPAIIRQVKPGTDIEAWFFCRGFDDSGTFWEEGEVLKALRDGYTTQTGRKIPYLVLITDFDRADREQAEHLRLITDSIQGRVDGPAGKTYKVLPGTIIVATANTSGGGDERGRMVSANPIDASLLDRFQRKFQFHWLDWRDEGIIVEAKFPLLVQRCPSAFKKMRTVTKALRDAILNGDLHGEFSHRALCDILSHAQDILLISGKVDKKLLKMAAKAWVDGLPDEENRKAARNILDPSIGMLDEGDTSHIGAGDLSDVLGGLE